MAPKRFENGASDRWIPVVFGPDRSFQDFSRFFRIFSEFSEFSRVSNPSVFLFALVRAFKLILKKKQNMYCTDIYSLVYLVILGFCSSGTPRGIGGSLHIIIVGPGNYAMSFSSR